MIDWFRFKEILYYEIYILLGALVIIGLGIIIVLFISAIQLHFKDDAR